MTTSARRPVRALAMLIGVALTVAGCTASGSQSADTAAAEPTLEPVVLTSNVEDQATDVGVDTIVSVQAEHGEVKDARLTAQDGDGTITGRLTGGGWVASQRLEPGTSYLLSVTGIGTDGLDQTLQSRFTTQPLTLAQQTYPSVAPLAGETVGVGMPVIVTFDIPVKNRALFERNMHVTSSVPDVDGSWSWFSDREVHYRPEEYWPADSTVNVSLKVNGLPAGDGIYGQQDQDIDFKIGRKAVSTVNVAEHTLTFSVDDKNVRTIPVSNGDNSHRTRAGTKVIMEKFDSVDMDAASTGVDADAPDYYNIEGVKWAMRVTNSGEFLHAAPWSAGSHGVANVSHGCTGMSIANADWLYHQSRRGDVVEYINSPRPLEDRNGWTDWNDPWSDWQERSALHRTS